MYDQEPCHERVKSSTDRDDGFKVVCTLTTDITFLRITGQISEAVSRV